MTPAIIIKITIIHCVNGFKLPALSEKILKPAVAADENAKVKASNAVMVQSDAIIKMTCARVIRQ